MGGEIISADSRQIYKGMDIGTGTDIGSLKFEVQSSKLESKIQKELEQKINVGVYRIGGVPVWGLDLIEPNQDFSAAHYLKFATIVMRDVWRREKSRPNVDPEYIEDSRQSRRDPRREASGLPILVGGTGFYIRVLIEGIETLGVRPDWELRWRLKDLPAQKLFNLLCRLDPGRAALMNASDRQNPRRIIRAIEVAKIRNLNKNIRSRIGIDKLLMIGLKAPNEVLYQKIDDRVEKRVKQGVEKEIKRLLKRGYGWQNSALGYTLGYQEWEPYFREKKVNKGLLGSTKEEVIQRWKYNEHGFARRQLTWFKKPLLRQPADQGENTQIKWFDITKRDWQAKAKKRVAFWLEN
jgi:tRNA dimethylallyltransferase